MLMLLADGRKGEDSLSLSWENHKIKTQTHSLLDQEWTANPGGQ